MSTSNGTPHFCILFATPDHAFASRSHNGFVGFSTPELLHTGARYRSTRVQNCPYVRPARPREAKGLLTVAPPKCRNARVSVLEKPWSGTSEVDLLSCQ
ncbi:uncharacterized protein L969DRAFT_51548 [Mixia osmundae IAM 14324]|uniref:Uncharacterized protein n=1 Tax=Mixia osmundae (strain CBS 9802 / IAM 14324 / JCM 22182 / KY 12970) TaxID=764103 RepID=G7DWN1_MIXOS|nr:uncharacterized protein L969DRAFT_51548 [Mixia osmundae IAM 14324]KEI37856.1 hypothetical protein L969DRAFT_51548 [Mixia osmundae IAM 14324]GAA94991.1 hypothetical protein E5Q_01646 [Mixia osmundae IAM 14324]